MVMVIKFEITPEQIEFLDKGSNICYPNGSKNVYYRLPWMKLSAGSNIIELLWGEKHYPEELQKMIKDEEETC
jgi:hypothetical protein